MSLRGRGRQQRAAGPAARVLVATPTYSGEMHHRYVESLMAALVHCLVHGVELELRCVAGASLIQYARNQLVREFLEDESFTHLLWIDSDVGFDPRAIVQLLSHEKDVVGGVYPMKCIPIEWPYEPMPGEQTTSLHRAKVLPNGFMLCSRKALQTLADRAPKYWHHMSGLKHKTAHIFDVALDADLASGGAVLLGEDVILCRNLIAAGIDVWCDPDISFSHHGQFRWSGNLRQAIEAEARHGTPQPALAALSSGDPLRMAVACDDLLATWGNSWSAPGGELLTLAMLARKGSRIFEAGSGVSTLVMAAANPGAEIHALEHDRHWADRIRKACAEAGLSNVTVHDAPMVPSERYGYQIPDGLPESFDLAFIDGPPFISELQNPTDSRRPLYELLATHLSDAVLVIDDVGFYRDIAERYDHEIVGERFAICKPRRMVKSSAA